MTIKTTIEVSDDYLVKAHDHFSFFNETAFYLIQTDVDVAPSLTNAGTINVVCDNGGGVTGIVASSDIHEDCSFWNEAGAHFYVSSDLGYQVDGMDLFYEHSSVRNDGELVIRGGDETQSRGVVARDASIVNTSTLTVVGGSATAVSIQSGEVDNSGDILASSAYESIGVSFGGQESTLENSGLILAQSGQWASATGVLVENFGSGSGSISNDGRIIARALDASAEIAIRWFNTQLGSEGRSDTLINTGLIQAEVALLDGDAFYSHGGSNQTIQNSGFIRGLIDLGQGDDHLTNTGKIVGDVYLGDGDDTLDGTGKLSGDIWAGTGSDLVVGAARAEMIHGDDPDPDNTDPFGQDTLIGGGGNDTLFGGAWQDRLQGGAGADVLTGGAGKDVFVLTSVSDSLVKHADLITDLGSGDKVDLSAVDANATIAGDQAFFLVESFDHHAGEARLSYDAVHDQTRLELDVNGDAKADALVLMAGDQTGFSGFTL